MPQWWKPFSAAGTNHKIPGIPTSEALGSPWQDFHFVSSLQRDNHGPPTVPWHLRISFVAMCSAIVKPQLKHAMEAKFSNLRANISHLERVQRLTSRSIIGSPPPRAIWRKASPIHPSLTQMQSSPRRTYLGLQDVQSCKWHNLVWLLPQPDPNRA